MPRFPPDIFRPIGWGLITLIEIASLALFFVVAAVDADRIFSPDSLTYLNSARALRQIRRFAIDPVSPDQPQIMRTPGYPLFLAIILFIGGDRYAGVILIQILLHLGTIGLTYHLTRRICTRQLAILAAVLLALDLASSVSAHQVLTETLFTFGFVLTLTAGLACLSPSHAPARLAMLYGSLLALTTLIRPITYYGIGLVVLIFPMLWRRVCRYSFGTIARALCALVLPWVVMIGGWHVRNWEVAGIPEFSGIQNYNLLFYRGAAIVARRDGISFAEAQHRLGYGSDGGLRPEMAQWSHAQRSQYWKQQAFELFEAHPLLMLRTHGFGLLKLLFGPAETSLLIYLGYDAGPTGPVKDLFTLPWRQYFRKWGREAPAALMLCLFANVHLLVVYGGVICSAITLARSPRRDSWPAHVFLGSWMGYLIVISAGPEAYARFRIPLMPLLCVYAAYGWSLVRRPRNLLMLLQD
jgi:4-amino-4-deoxy-L-arabinose transferase-like glycosyltransferase